VSHWFCHNYACIAVRWWLHHHGAAFFPRTKGSLSYSRNFLSYVEPRSSLSYLQEPASDMLS
jgi:hypothetical protein